MKVSVDVRHVGLPGVGRFATELAAALLRRTAGPDVVALTLAPGRATRAGWLGTNALSRPAGVEMRSRPFAPWAGRELSRAARAAGVTVHHATHLTVPAGLTMPSVLTVHDLFPLVQRRHARSMAATAYYRRVLPRSVRRAKATVAVSAYTATEMDRVLGVRPDAVIGHGVDHAVWRHLERGCAPAPDGVPSEPYVLYVGTAKPHKNLATLLRAHAGASRLPPLVLAGPTDAEAAACGAVGGGRVIALGRVADATLPALYRGAGAVAVPSLYEGVGLVALEAMSFGVPVVAADSPGLRDTVGDAAALAPAGDPAAWADALDRLVSGRGGVPLRELLVERGRARVAPMRWDDVATAYVEVYESVADSEHRPMRRGR